MRWIVSNFLQFWRFFANKNPLFKLDKRMFQADKCWVRLDPCKAVPNSVFFNGRGERMSIAAIQKTVVHLALRQFSSGVKTVFSLRGCGEYDICAVYDVLLVGDGMVVPFDVG